MTEMLFSEAVLTSLHEVTRSVTSVKDRSHLTTTTCTFDVVRNGSHGYQCCSTLV